MHMLDEKRGHSPWEEEEYFGRFSEAFNKFESTFGSQEIIIFTLYNVLWIGINHFCVVS